MFLVLKGWRTGKAHFLNDKSFPSVQPYNRLPPLCDPPYNNFPKHVTIIKLICRNKRTIGLLNDSVALRLNAVNDINNCIFFYNKTIFFIFKTRFI